VFEITQLPTPEPGAGEVLIKVAYAGVNPADWKFREGHSRQFFPMEFPFVIGFDAAGVVVATGEGASEFVLGDRVFTPSDLGQGKHGSYAEYVVASRDRVALIPEGMSMKSAAVIPVAALTGWQALFASDKGDMHSGQRILINGASGGLGSFAVQFAKFAGAEVATTCSGANLDYVSGLGADLLIDYKIQDVGEELSRWAPEGVDMVLDAVSCGSLIDPFAMLKPGGKLVSIATIVGDGDIEVDMVEAAKRGVSKVFAMMTDSDSRKDLEKIAALVTTGSVTMPPIECFDLADVSAAHRKIQDGHVRGKLVLRVAGEL
jgi:NADPH2:quinone reductase